MFSLETLFLTDLDVLIDISTETEPNLNNAVSSCMTLRQVHCKAAVLSGFRSVGTHVFGNTDCEGGGKKCS